MISYEEVIQENSQFQSLCNSENNCNAFLFESSDESFLNNFSYEFAKFLFCNGDKKPCNKCLSCQKVFALSHSDLKVYPQNRKNVLVDDIKNLIENIYLSPIESDKKVFIFNNFSSANLQAQNKLLKILEEPPQNSYIILNVTNVSKVLPTILSRCKKIRLSALSDQDIARCLNVNSQDIQSVLSLAQGSLASAEKYKNDSNFAKVFDNCLKTIIDMKDSKQLIKYSSSLSSDKSEVMTVLEVLEMLYRDLLFIKMNKLELVKNKNTIIKLSQIKTEYTLDSIDLIIKKLYQIKKQLDFNCNTVLLIDNLLLYILEVKFYAKSGC